jgi:hypothetical protein
MRSKFNELTGLYEQVSDDVLPQDVDMNAAEPAAPVEKAPITGGDTGKLHGFIVDSGNIGAVNQLISGKVNEFKSEVPLKVLGKDGSIGAEAMMNGKPLYLMIKTYKSKSERASSDVQLEESDRIYLLFNTSASELTNLINEADNIDDRISVAVKDPTGKEHTVSIWKGNIGTQPDQTDDTLNTDDASVNVDMDAQIENPGTAAGISGTVQENKKIKNMKNSSRINEQGDAKFDAIQNRANAKILANMDKKPDEKPKNKLNTEQQAVVSNLGSNAKTINLANGSAVVSLKLTKANTGIDGMAYFYANNTMQIKTKSGGKILVQAKYKDGGKTITVNGKSAVTSGSVYGNLKTITKPDAKTNTTSNVEQAFKTQADGDAFRTWANSTPELTAKYGATSPFKLDASGKFNNSYINKAYAAAKTEYATAKEQGEKEKSFKYKEGDIVYYKITKEGKVEVEKDILAGDIKSAIDKQKDEMAKDKTPNAQEAKYKSDSFGANPRVSEAIATSFSTFKSILEDDENADVDKVAGLMKDFKEGNVKKGKVIKQIDDSTIKLLNLTSKVEATVNVSDIIDKEDALAASLKIKAAREAEEKAKAEADAKAAEAKKSDVSGAKDELSSARDEKRDAKQKFRDTKKTKRKNKKIEKVNKKTDEINKKTDAVNTSESVVYSFDDFIKKVNKLN